MPYRRHKKPKGHLALDSLAGTLKGTKEGKVVTAGDSAPQRPRFLGLSPMSVTLILTCPRAKMPRNFITDDQIGLIRARGSIKCAKY